MRTTVTLDENLVKQLKGELGISETSALIRRALEEMRYTLAARQAELLGGSDPSASAPNEADAA